MAEYMQAILAGFLFWGLNFALVLLPFIAVGLVLVAPRLARAVQHRVKGS